MFQACQFSLNLLGDGKYFGLQPTLSYPTIAGPSACRVEPSPDQNSAYLHATEYLVEYPVQVGDNQLLQLIADQEHIEAIAASLIFVLPGITPSETPSTEFAEYTSPTLPIRLMYPSVWTNRGLMVKAARMVSFN